MKICEFNIRYFIVEYDLYLDWIMCQLFDISYNVLLNTELLIVF